MLGHVALAGCPPLTVEFFLVRFATSVSRSSVVEFLKLILASSGSG